MSRYLLEAQPSRSPDFKEVGDLVIINLIDSHSINVSTAIQQLDMGEDPQQAHTPHPIALADADLIFYPTAFTAVESDRWLAELTKTIEWRQEQIELFGRSLGLPRLTAWYGDQGKSYTYSGLTMMPTPWTKELLILKSHVDALSGVTFNSVLLNLYRTGNDSMGWHSDDEPELGQNPIIGSLSFGATRRFGLRHKFEKRLRHQLELTSGSFLLMQGKTQHYWQHQIAKTKRAIAPRINLTFRIIH
jgi:alkylated DNA repair dioxygenase AlkB